jgi:hypothetical protein
MLYCKYKNDKNSHNEVLKKAFKIIIKFFFAHLLQTMPTMDHGLVLLLLYALRHRSILGAAGHIILTPANQLMEEEGLLSEPPEQSCLLRWTEKIASLCFGPSGDRTPYLLIRSESL